MQGSLAELPEFTIGSLGQPVNSLFILPPSRSQLRRPCRELGTQPSKSSSFLFLAVVLAQIVHDGAWLCEVKLPQLTVLSLGTNFAAKETNLLLQTCIECIHLSCHLPQV